MLGPDRFASFETPNVIDPGDDAPLQPPRRRSPAEPQQTSGQSTAGAPRSSSRAPGLGRTEKIDLGDYQQARQSRLINSIDELDLVEQQQQQQQASGDGSSVGDDPNTAPSIDEARNYASALLQDANRRTSSRELAVIGGDEEPTNIPAGLMSPLAASDYGSKAMVRNQVWPVIFKVSGIVMAIVLVILVLSRMSF